MAKKEAPRLVTPRLTLRRLTETDILAMSRLFVDAEVTRYLTGDTPPSDEHSMLKIVRARRETEWAITLTATGEFLGIALMPKITADYLGEIGCVLLREFWRNSYATEALDTLITHSRATLGLKQLCARIDSENVASRRLTEKLGFALDAVLPEADFGGRVCDLAYYSKKL